MRFVDTHTHICDEAFNGEREAFLDRALAVGVSKMLQADIDSSEREDMFAECKAYPGVLFPMLGLYPGSVAKDWQKEIALLEPWFKENPVAVGEIGLDYHYGADFKDEQKEALRVQFELAAEHDLPVNIHLRDATEDFVNIVKDCAHLHLRGNLHAYSGSSETFMQLRQYADFSLGIGGVVTFKNAKLPQVVKDVPLEFILLETDAPYLTPVPLRGSRNESANIPLIAAKVAEIKGLSIEKIAEATTTNAEKLFAI